MSKKLYDFPLDEFTAANFKPATKEEEIIQNVLTICTTRKGSRPMDRDFGINFIVVDQPMAKEQARITQEIVQALKKYEPRVEITEIYMGWSKYRNSLWPCMKFRVKDD